MTIVLTGGGSGGHITPILAVADELKRTHPDVRLVYIGQKGDGLIDIPSQHPTIDKTYTIYAGKLRRYHGEGLKQLLDIKTVLLNIRDIFLVLLGLVQSFFLLLKLKPNAIFVKGGFVGVPVGLSAAALRIPYITHDSDAVPGLANRIIAKWARAHAVGLPKEVYNYPRQKTFTVGVPTQDAYRPVTPELQKQYRRELGLDKYRQVVLVTGGGLGAKRVNDAIVANGAWLLEQFPEMAILNLVGRAHENAVQKAYEAAIPESEFNRVIVKGFVTDLYRYSGAADVVIARAGATNMAEFAVQGKACIIVPNPYLTGGHQLKNAQVLEDNQAIALVSEAELKEDVTVLGQRLAALLQAPEERSKLEKNLNKLAHPHSARELAVLLLDQTK